MGGFSKFGAPGREGLLTKIIRVLIKQPKDSEYRFWLAQCVESFLRGSDPKHQQFVAQSGLLEVLLNGIIGPEYQASDNLQTNFDLLGELVKFNEQVFTRFSDHLTAAQMDRLIDISVSNLVDSNVFLRAAVLSFDHFRTKIRTEGASGVAYDLANCRLFQFIEQNRVRLVRDLMTVVHADSVNQENICCLNTLLVFFIMARRNSAVEPLLEQVHALEGPNGFAKDNFRQLMSFWRQYYSNQGRDILSLEFSSRIPFSEWDGTWKAVNPLLLEDGEGTSL